jgi:hypothetical protein
MFVKIHNWKQAIPNQCLGFILEVSHITCYGIYVLFINCREWSYIHVGKKEILTSQIHTIVGMVNDRPTERIHTHTLRHPVLSTVTLFPVWTLNSILLYTLPTVYQLLSPSTSSMLWSALHSALQVSGCEVHGRDHVESKQQISHIRLLHVNLLIIIRKLQEKSRVAARCLQLDKVTCKTGFFFGQHARQKIEYHFTFKEKESISISMASV